MLGDKVKIKVPLDVVLRGQSFYNGMTGTIFSEDEEVVIIKLDSKFWHECVIHGMSDRPYIRKEYIYKSSDSTITLMRTE